MSKFIRFWSVFSLVFIILIFPFVVGPCPSWGQDYPTKPVQIVSCWSPGGFTPIMAVLLAEESKKYLSQPAVAVFKPGAAGTIGAYAVATSPPDGYTLLMATMSHTAIIPQIQKVDYAPQDFEHMGQVANNPFTLVVRADSPWKSLKDLVNDAKKNPGLFTCGNSGANGAHHLTALRFEKIAGIKLTHVPFKGDADSMSALAGGHIGMSLRSPGGGEALIEGGKLKVLTVFDSQRCKFYPQVPTSKEEGFPLEAGAWAVLMAPKGTPKGVLTTWENIIKKATEDKSFNEKADKARMNIVYRSAEDFKKYYLGKVQEFGEILKELGFKLIER